jgi:hypothetical protein
MNTPPKKKRFTPPDFSKPFPQGTIAYGLTRDDYKVALAQIVADFEHLEFQMPAVLQALLQTPWSDAAGYVYRSIRGPSIKINLMQHLLHVAPHNVDTPEFIDEILWEYGAIRKARNEYVHGLWTTHLDDNSVYLARFPEHGEWMERYESEPEPLEALGALAERIGRLKVRVWTEVLPYLAKLRQQHLEFARRASEREAVRQQRRESKEPQPPPPPSPASPQTKRKGS